ncbi:MAG TPA: DUF1893 domain-containing protein [Candidatus Bathyarchaeia archaeon]|nr:DUF1893 domain-containing protein [Candidatus Bathyarchaeia archaeon]
MTDLDIAKTELYEEQLTLIIVKNGEALFQTKSHRISGFLEAIEKLGDKLEGASLADRVAGKAIALLCIYAKIQAVYAAVLSRKAYMVFKQNKISVQWGELVENVLDVNKGEVCPFEKAAADISDPEKAYNAFRRLLQNLKPCK